MLFFFTVLLLVSNALVVKAMRLPLEVETGVPNATDGMVVIGDMMMPYDLHEYLTSSQVLRKIIGPPNYLWPEESGYPTLPFRIDSSVYVYEGVIRDGMDHWKEHTCIRFRETTEIEKRYINFIRDNGCWSYVGRTGTNGKQEISIGNGCQYLGTVVHEIGHAIGFIHEQMRPDRDTFLNINWDNVNAVYQGQFQKFPSSSYFTYNVEYDYTSVMQYGGTDFSNNGKLTMATKSVEYQGLLGTGQTLSHRDKMVVNTHYGCIAKWENDCKVTADSCLNGGYMGSKCQCVCPPATNGTNCQTKTGNYYDDKVPSCSRVITEETEITTPNYPSNIPQGSWCVYQIQAPEGKVVQLTFDDFDLEQYSSSWPNRCARAFLEIRDREMYEGTIACGTDIKIQESIESVSRDMVLYLDTPYSSRSRGFKAAVTFVDKETSSSTTDGGDGLREEKITTTEGSATVPTTNILLIVLVPVVLTHIIRYRY